MHIKKADLLHAVEKGLLKVEQVEPLYDYLRSIDLKHPKFDFTHVLYYLGGLIAIGALSLFMNLGWDRFGGWGVFFISLLYAGIGFKITNYFRNKQLHIPAGICGAFIVALTPLAIYGFQKAMGWWPDDTPYREYHRYIKFLWIYMELGALAVGAFVFWKYRYPFLIMPIAATLWYLSIDIAELVVNDLFSYRERALVTMWFGLAMMLFALLIDIRSCKTLDYAFWLYIFGVMAFWGGLTSQHSDSELAKFFYFCINLVLIGFGVLIVRRVFVVFGAIGCAIYLGHLANEVFKDSWLFPIALTVIGLAVMYLGVFWQKNETKLTEKLRSYLPVPLRELIEGK